MYEFKIGDKVRCKPGFDNKGSSRFDFNYGGVAYKESREFIIDKISEPDHERPVAWEKGMSGVYIDAIELVEKKIYKKKKLIL